MNEKGNSLFFGLIILMIFSCLGLHFIKKRMNQISVLKNKQELLLCTKQVNGLTTNLIKTINTTNYWLKVATITDLLSITIPYLGTAAKLSTKQAIKTLKAVQMVKTTSYVKNIARLHRARCSFNLSIYKTPIKYYIAGIKRNKYNEAYYREKKWTYKIYSKEEMTKNSVTKSGNVESILTKKVNLLSKLF